MLTRLAWNPSSSTIPHKFDRMFFIVSDMSLADNSKGKDGEEPPGVSQKSSEEFTDVKHESLFSLETNFLEEESGGSYSQRTSQGESGSCCPDLLLWQGCALIEFSHWTEGVQ